MKNIVLSIAMMASVSAFAQQKATIEIYPEKGNQIIPVLQFRKILSSKAFREEKEIN